MLSQTKGRGTQGVGGVASHFFIVRTNQSEVFGDLFNADEAQTSVGPIHKAFILHQEELTLRQ